MFTAAILQRATVKPPNINAHEIEKGSKFHAQSQINLGLRMNMRQLVHILVHHVTNYIPSGYSSP